MSPKAEQLCVVSVSEGETLGLGLRAGLFV